MNFLIVTHVTHKYHENRYYGYAPYIREMNLWNANIQKVIIIAPLESKGPEKEIEIAYDHSDITFIKIPSFSFTSLKNSIKALFVIPYILMKLFGAMRRVDHIHLRCPGNIGLLGCLVQILFPKKPKTAKYAGNWDPDSKQPLSYNFQKWILGNSRISKNLKVLVYGDWPGQSKNIYPFFTASYSQKDIKALPARDYKKKVEFLFIGTLSKGKDPKYALQLVEKLRREGVEASLAIYGDGFLMDDLKRYIKENALYEYITLYGNQSMEVVKTALQKAHFLVLPSKSEGWPKVVAEAMFWGCIPIVTRVSCVPWMLGDGKRGVFLEKNPENDLKKIRVLIEKSDDLEIMAEDAADWSRQFTIESFKTAIKNLL